MQPWEYSGHPGRRLVTPHYEVYSTIRDERLVTAFPDLIERAFEYYQRLVPSSRTPPARMQVYLFANRPQWAQFTRTMTGPLARQYLRIRNGGFSRDGVSVMQYATHDLTFPLVAHEGLHQYLYFYAGGPVPAWLNEGLAVLCEGQRWSGGRLEGFDPWYNPLRRNALAEAVRAGRTYSLVELLETNASRVLDVTDKRVGTYYAQVWALVLFLRYGEDGKYAAKFEGLLGRLGAENLEQPARAAHIWSERSEFNYGEALFRSFITEDLETFEREYVAFLRRQILGDR